jgi:hypothetical protein
MARRNVTKEWDPAKCVHAMQTRGRRVEMVAGVSWRHSEADPVVDTLTCVYCKKQLPLGPSNDEPAACRPISATQIDEH